MWIRSWKKTEQTYCIAPFCNAILISNNTDFIFKNSTNKFPDPSRRFGECCARICRHPWVHSSFRLDSNGSQQCIHVLIIEVKWLNFIYIYDYSLCTEKNKYVKDTTQSIHKICRTSQDVNMYTSICTCKLPSNSTELDLLMLSLRIPIIWNFRMLPKPDSASPTYLAMVPRGPRTLPEICERPCPLGWLVYLKSPQI